MGERSTLGGESEVAPFLVLATDSQPCTNPLSCIHNSFAGKRQLCSLGSMDQGVTQRLVSIPCSPQYTIGGVYTLSVWTLMTHMLNYLSHTFGHLLCPLLIHLSWFLPTFQLPLQLLTTVIKNSPDKQTYSSSFSQYNTQLEKYPVLD